MTFVAAFISSNWVSILALLGTLASGMVAFLTKKSSDAKVALANQKAAEAQAAAAQAQTQTAETRDVAAQANAKAAQAAAQAVKERSDVEADTAGKSDSAVRDELRAWVQPDGAGAGTAAGAGANADR